MHTWFEQLLHLTGLAPGTLSRLLESVGIVLAIIVLRMIATREIRRKVDDVKRAYYWRRMVNYTAGLLMVLLVARTWISGLQNIGTFLGLVSAGVAIALSDPLSNLAGWMFILTRRPYVVGDRIEIDGHVGDVIDIRLFQTFLLECGQWVDADQSTGRIIMVPNNRVFKSTTANYTHGFEYIWDEIEVLVTFESDWRRAKQIMIEVARDHAQPLSEGAQEQIRSAARKHMIFFRNLTPIVYTAVKDSGVQFSIRYLTHPRPITSKASPRSGPRCRRSRRRPLPRPPSCTRSPLEIPFSRVAG
ncbi:MAG: mechanosensitive ion channel family protein [Planctomycetota bacterium]|jgi:small-conductance mechanosensitive channel